MGLSNATNPIHGTYSAKVSTGFLTGLVATTTDATGQIGSFRWTSATKTCFIQRLKATWQTTTGFTAAQGLGLEVIKVATYTAEPSGGTKVVGSVQAVGNGFKMSLLAPDSAIASLWISTTGVLTTGTFAATAGLGLDTVAIGFGYAAAAAVEDNGRFVCEADFSVNGEDGLRISANEGLILRNLIAMGAGGLAKVAWQIDWTEKIIPA